MKDKREIPEIVGPIFILVLLLVVILFSWMFANDFKDMQETHFRIYLNESGELIEVEDILFKSENTTSGYEFMRKQDLTLWWLDKTCACLEGNCVKYKCWDYTVEVWLQIK